jgi:hypothetical protein
LSQSPRAEAIGDLGLEIYQLASRCGTVAGGIQFERSQGAVEESAVQLRCFAVRQIGHRTPHGGDPRYPAIQVRQDAVQPKEVSVVAWGGPGSTHLCLAHWYRAKRRPGHRKPVRPETRVTGRAHLCQAIRCD